MPHQASYDVGLAEASDQLLGVQGKIAVAFTTPADCNAYGIAYRFVARFLKDQDIVVTDQQIRLNENRDGKHFRFTSESFVDSILDSTTRGEAFTADGKTTVTYEEPEAQAVSLPLSIFPIHHTRQIIESAEAGVPIMESHVFQGDADAEKNTTSTVIIMPLGEAELASEIAGYGRAAEPKADEPTVDGNDDAVPIDGPNAPVTPPDGPQAGSEAQPNGAAPDAETGEREGPAEPGLDSGPEAPSDLTPPDGDAAADMEIMPSDGDRTASEPAAIASRLKGLQAWRISESFYNSDSNENGLAVFQATYTLFENGVTGNQLLKFDGYMLRATLASLDVQDAPSCAVPAGG